MTERPILPSAEETSPLHERGGLTPEHWQLIASVDFDDPKINQYASAKAAGLIDEGQGPFIGKRHWRTIRSKAKQMKEKVQVKIKFTPFHRTELEQTLQGKQLEEIAEEQERITPTTLNDHFHFLTREYCVIYDDDESRLDSFMSAYSDVPPDEYSWDLEKQSWWKRYPDLKWTGGGVYAPMWREESARYTFLLNRFLITENEIGNIVETPPEKLFELVKSLPEEELLQRLKNYEQKEAGGWEKPIPSDWEMLFSRYKETRYFPSPAYESILNRPLSLTSTQRERRHGQSTSFEDLEAVTYFYNLSPENLGRVLAQQDRKVLGIYSNQFEHDDEVVKSSGGVLLYRDRGGSETTIGEKLKQLNKNGGKVTHIVCADEIYGGETHYSTWRDYRKAEIYEVPVDYQIELQSSP